MKKEECDKIKWCFLCSMSLASEHVLQYYADGLKGVVSMCTISKRKNNGDFGKGKTYYYVKDKEYSNYEDFCAAMEPINANADIKCQK